VKFHSKTLNEHDIATIKKRYTATLIWYELTLGVERKLSFYFYTFHKSI